MGKHFVAENCTAIGPAPCTVENTIYGYYPNLGLNAFFVAAFAALVIPQIIIGTWKKQYFYSYAIACGCIGEAIGYGGRVMMHSNPYKDIAFTIQISCLIFSPAFIAAGIYLVLKHIVRAFGEERSRIPARYYTWIFITCDWISLMLQAIGGGMAGGAKDNVSKRNMGTNLMIIGIVWQVGTLIVFACLVTDYAIRTSRSWGIVSADAKNLFARRSFKGFLVAVAVAFITVFLRCVYRIAEMVGGWANPIMRDETGFVIMEGFMILIAASVLTLFHPGFCFSQPGLAQKSPMLGSISSSDVAQNEAEKGVSARQPRFLRVSRQTSE
ncbi:RTA1-domain-containing protein [Mollisia scopiformis]|uniref:RTA1-domain-containing protein n=1 Tax=Mollisia scopiformis TaxID=149040 RepID=A0A194XHM0_MOLSC|nr:RTA1-domain-containing protein [Mollisia scopiformis]KUJ19710.1 RTA1-domain-containing protein [Mollisia scopiformis]